MSGVNGMYIGSQKQNKVWPVVAGCWLITLMTFVYTRLECKGEWEGMMTASTRGRPASL